MDDSDHKNQILSEGLIISYPIDIFKRSLGKLSWTRKIYSESPFILLVTYDYNVKLSQEQLSEIQQLCDLHGYFIVRDSWHNLQPTLMIEAKYPQLLDDLNLPHFAYHVTPSKNIPKIKKNGLLPRDTNRVYFNHPGNRLYLLLNNDEIKELSDQLKRGRPEDEKSQTVLEINLHELETHQFFIDPQYEAGVFTLRGIPPNKITFPE